MDSANEDLAEAKPDAETVAEPPPPTAAVGEKRTATAASIEDAGGESVVAKNLNNKKMRKGVFSSAEEEKELRSVAEIVLVLSALGTMRAGRDPTAAEKAMMAEARTKVVQLCEELAPRDIIPREAFGGIIEDLGLSRLKEQKLGFRAPKLSIAEKMEITKKKMAESKQLIAPTASPPAQRPQAGMGVPGGTSTASRSFSSEKASHLPSAGPVTLSFQPSAHQPRPSLISTGIPTSTLGNNPTSAAIKFERPQQRSDGRLIGPSPATQAPVSGSYAVKTPNTSLQPQSTALGNVGARNKAPDHSFVRPQVSTSMHQPVLNPQVTHLQSMKPVMTQGAPGTIPAMHHAVQGVHYVQTSQLLNHHLEISKMVQTFLHPKPLEHPVWDLPSREYMNKVVTCQICKSTSNEMENVLICDACEKGFHLKCLQTGNPKGLPRGEWHCPRCLTISNGKPFPPKYGRVTRNSNTTKTSSNTSGFQSQKKPETNDQAPKVQKSVASVNRNEGNLSHTASMAETSGVIAKPDNNIHRDEASQGTKKVEPSSSKNVSSDRVGTPSAVVEGNCKPSAQHNVKSEQICPVENLEDETKSNLPANPSSLHTADQHLSPSVTNVKSEQSCPMEHLEDEAKLNLPANPSCLHTADQPLSPSVTNPTPSSSAPDGPTSSSLSVDHTGDPSCTDVPSQNNANKDEAPKGVDGSLQPPSPSDPVHHPDSSRSVDQTGGLCGTAVSSQDNAIEDGTLTAFSVSAQPPSCSASDHPPSSCKSVDQTGDPACTEAPSQFDDNDDGASSGVEVSLEQHDENNKLIKGTKRPDGSEATNHQLTLGDVKQNVLENQLGMNAVEADIQLLARVSEDNLHKVEWVGDASRVVDTKKFYQSCRVTGADYKVNDHVLVRSGDGKLIPWKLQAMWEDYQTSVKWVIACQCYFPDDLPAEVGHPSAPEANEVYESNQECTLMAGRIQGPCEVRPVNKFSKENGEVDPLAQESGDHPVFLCRWFYDKAKGVFHPVPS